MTRRSPQPPRTTQRRVLFVAPSAYRLSGVATWLDHLLPGLTDRGFEVTLGLAEGPRHHRPEAYLAAHPFDRTIAIGCASGTATGRVRAVRDAIAKTEPDLVVNANIPDSLVAVAEEQAAGRTVRGIQTCHGIQPDLFDDLIALRPVADAVICTNRLACDLATELSGWPPERVGHAWYGTVAAGPAPPREDDASFTIAYAGRIEEDQKRTRDLIPIAERLAAAWPDRPWRMLVAGDGPDREALERGVAEAGLAGVVQFLGHVSGEELPERLWHRADALIMPSQWETGPIVIWEAMAHGVPVVTSQYVGSGQEGVLLDGQSCLMFAIGDAETAASRLATLRDDPPLRTQLRESGRALVAGRSSVAASCDRWVETLDRLGALPILPKRPPQRAARGTLDRVLGLRAAETVRRGLGRTPEATGPGDEWPHRLAGYESDAAPIDPDRFWHVAADRDRRDRNESLRPLLSAPLSPCGPSC